ncbi:MAG: hypothetical protein VXZ72_03435 [Chlamydiota bacterium]|nr:hypothetical protein [Chlamydiota bacterium]
MISPSLWCYSRYQELLDKKWWQGYARQSTSFAAYQKAFKHHYRGINPYRVTCQHGPHNPYGETPAKTLIRIGAMLELSPWDHLIELGSGRGRSGFFFHDYWKCSVTCLEKVPLFVEKSQAILKDLPSLPLNIKKGDISSFDWPRGVTALYCYSTGLHQTIINSLAKQISGYSLPLRIVMISESLPASPCLTLIETHILSFFWGKTRGHLYQYQP